MLTHILILGFLERPPLRRHLHLRLLHVLRPLRLLVPRPILVQPCYARFIPVRMADSDEHHELGHRSHCCCIVRYVVPFPTYAEADYVEKDNN